jgi:hypothetical protein
MMTQANTTTMPISWSIRFPFGRRCALRAIGRPAAGLSGGMCRASRFDELARGERHANERLGRSSTVGDQVPFGRSS